jgi:hypothetical protein
MLSQSDGLLGLTLKQKFSPRGAHSAECTYRVPPDVGPMTAGVIRCSSCRMLQGHDLGCSTDHQAGKMVCAGFTSCRATLVFCGESRRDFRISPPRDKLPRVNAS